MSILVTTANGMFGGAVVRALARDGQPVRAMVRNRAAFTFAHPRVEVVEADLDRPETLGPALAGVSAVFLATPMDARLAVREQAVIDAAERAGVTRLVKLGGAVRHDHDPLAVLHGAVQTRLEASGLAWSYISPNSVMETSLLGFASTIRDFGCLFGISGPGRIGLVALQDVADAAAAVLASPGHEHRDYQLTGPEALDLASVAMTFTRVLGRPVVYHDLSELAFKDMLAPVLGLADADMELNILCHLRCWRDGKADLVTDAFRELLGRGPTSLEAWIGQHREVYSGVLI